MTLIESKNRPDLLICWPARYRIANRIKFYVHRPSSVMENINKIKVLNLQFNSHPIFITGFPFSSINSPLPDHFLIGQPNMSSQITSCLFIYWHRGFNVVKHMVRIICKTRLIWVNCLLILELGKHQFKFKFQ